jgi:glycerophosphoryl diester phosphodiesterase
MIEDIVKALLLRNEASDKVIIQCQHSSCIADVRTFAPHIKVLARVFTREQFDLALRDHPYLIQVDADLMSEELARAAEAAGSLLLVKTLGEPPDTIDSWRALCAMGADVILTDHPRSFLQYREDEL